MKKIILTLSVSCFSMAYSQNLNFADSKFKALILSSSASNDIAKDISGSSIAVDANGDGEIQISEAQQVKILSVNQDPNQMYINPNGNPADINNINLAYYNSHLPDGITDALLFPNVEELYFGTTKSAAISFINNSKIKKVKGRPYYYDTNQQGQYVASSINLSFNNCSGIQDIANVIAYQSTLNSWSADENVLKIKNCTQINSNAIIDLAELTELYIENSSISTLTFNSCKRLKKISVPNLSTLTKVSVSGENGLSAPGYSNQNIELIASNCINLQEITADTDHYNTSGAYFSSVDLNGCTSLKKIKGLNSASINFSTAGLINLEELDCSFYNRNIYSTTSGVYFGDVTSLDLTGLPKLKILKAFNQKITNNVNFSAAATLQNIDITSSAGYMSWVNVNNLANLHTLKTDRFETSNTQGNDDLQKISAKNCVALTNFIFRNNNQLKELDIQNCPGLQKISIGYYAMMNDGVFPELNTINLQQCTGMKDITIQHTKITHLNTSDCIALTSLDLYGNDLLPSINLANNTKLEYIGLKNMALISQVNTSTNHKLKSAHFSNCPQITELNLSYSPDLQYITLWNMPNLASANIKNGSIEEGVDFMNYKDNFSVCVDNDQLSDLQALYSDITFTTGCGSFLTTTDSKIKNSGIKIAPNPVKDFVTVSSEESIKNVTVFDAQGRIIFNENFNNEMARINLSAYPGGVYNMRIKTDKTEFSKKIIKE
ncbi:T9SS type A sorting domain-containing protein [Chryseobacterium angstadtii]|nr:T9SS type A sorting domain-containing protein [Chryseobacterium angstadtii]